MNPGFEDRNVCTEYKSECAPEGWLGITYDFPLYTLGKNNFVSLISTPGTREYIQTQFLCEMEEGEEYEISLKIKINKTPLKSFGIYISEQIFYRKNNERILVEPTIDLSDNINSISEKSRKNWTVLTFTYTAKGGEKFILIGNFAKEVYEPGVWITKEDLANYMYSLDDVSVTRINTAPLCHYSDSIKNSWYNYNYAHRPITFVPYIYKPETNHTELNDSLQIESVDFKKKADSLILSDIIFESNSSRISDEARQLIEEKFMLYDISQIKEIHISGHTDNVGKSDYNETLSLKRANALKEVLISTGIDENKISTIGKGDTDPIADNSTEDGRKLNRRIEIQIIYE